jgi:hypothetical protein
MAMAHNTAVPPAMMDSRRLLPAALEPYVPSPERGYALTRQNPITERMWGFA